MAANCSTCLPIVRSWWCWGVLFFTGPLYTPYLLAPRIFGISVGDDQTLGARIMWIPGTIVYLIAMTFIFYAWFERHEGQEDALGAEQLP